MLSAKRLDSRVTTEDESIAISMGDNLSSSRIDHPRMRTQVILLDNLLCPLLTLFFLVIHERL